MATGGGAVVPVQVALQRARVAQEIGRIEEARRILGTALLDAPEDPYLLVALADIAYELDEYDDTLRLAGQALRANPESSGAHHTVALAYAMLDQWDPAREHGHTAARLRPHDAATALLLAWLHSSGPRRDPEQARAALAHATALAPNDVHVHFSAAQTYQRLSDSGAAERHVAAGLAIDPTHAGLLGLHARAEFAVGGVDGGRAAAIATLRGLLANAPTDRQARRLLAEVHWRALLRLAAWVWAFAGCYAALAMWLPTIALRVLSPMMFFAVPLAWFGVFRKLRKQLPPGYLRARATRPRAVIALAAVAVSAVLVDLAAAAMRSEFVALVRLGGLVLVLGVLGAALGHLLLFTAWMRPGRDDPDPDDGEDFAGFQIIVLGLFVVPVVIVVAFLRGWARQPAVFGALVAIVGIVFLTLLVEAAIAGWRDRGNYRRSWQTLVIVLVVLAMMGGSGGALWWGGGEIVRGETHGRDLLDEPATSTSTTTFRPLPTLPSRLVPTPTRSLPSGAVPTAAQR
ncbi:tetratricopeptide repeat protein [Nocardia sp. NPDC060249]|uniref:tetratricopeptide repeat protein n=1 Tax=Nocardia sp. NPDC060249 TaxID=3347082 RepID=UPI00365C81ED